MAKFRSARELESYKLAFGIVTSTHRAVLIHPARITIHGEMDHNLDKPKLREPVTVELPADQVQHYLDKGFKWAE